MRSQSGIYRAQIAHAYQRRINEELHFEDYIRQENSRKISKHFRYLP